MAIVKAEQIAQAGNYPAYQLNKREQKVLEVADQFAPADSTAWGAAAPDSITDALDQLASSGQMKTISATYDFSIQGGTTGVKLLGVNLPDNAIVVEVIRDELTAATSTSSTGTILLGVATDGALEQTALTADGGAVTVASSGGTAVPKKLTAARELQVTIATNNVLAGKIQYFVRYMQGE